MLDNHFVGQQIIVANGTLYRYSGGRKLRGTISAKLTHKKGYREL